MKTKQFVILTLLVVALVSVVVACGSSDSDVLTSHAYNYVIIDGMPCLQGYRRLSCDWSYWTGSIDGERVIVPGRE